ncbi:hypothetical protein KEM60_03175 [Austwickia sp. TVS 96-490-7B]|uniref:nucleotide-binding protein n=1 Tax=Austwickia sp. TVS 96-490-7B TaxID=2830843 RepID=UPI001C5A2118|nr:hypothetical protein [Austwickia sp. TVS 96-490-7B]MBW3086946.1 hypothetical protein [Austwickia sp. TVS 96-490-7B]
MEAVHTTEATTEPVTDRLGNGALASPTQHSPLSAQVDMPVRVVTGHYGSGKTEVCVSLAMQLAQAGHHVAVGDLDIVNPYFRSREQAEMMEAAGVQVVSSSLGHNLTLDLPAVSARIRVPLADPTCETILDVGGNGIGAKVLVEFAADIQRRTYEVLLVVNAYRPETRDVAGVVAHLNQIEAWSTLSCTGLISNTHLLRETGVDDVLAGYRLTKAVSDETGLPVRHVCALPHVLAQIEEEMDGDVLPIGMFMRDIWM